MCADVVGSTFKLQCGTDRRWFGMCPLTFVSWCHWLDYSFTGKPRSWARYLSLFHLVKEMYTDCVFRAIVHIPVVFSSSRFIFPQTIPSNHQRYTIHPFAIPSSCRSSSLRQNTDTLFVGKLHDTHLSSKYQQQRKYLSWYSSRSMVPCTHHLQRYSLLQTTRNHKNLTDL